ncbi:hypothetical protein [Anatilimnocola floriformis]|uniref:hypothetical protein n=1 Tax=Anatilimnocola floriformis TaxID=2948575 RepID=UPI0020C4AF39|nr:hypothetical protein [Anatilimnocola floriformis]
MNKVLNLLLFALRYSPLAMMVVLVAAWLASIFCVFGWHRIFTGRSYSAVGVDANIRLVTYLVDDRERGFFAEPNPVCPTYFGAFEFHINGWPRGPKYDVDDSDTVAVNAPAATRRRPLFPLSLSAVDVVSHGSDHRRRNSVLRPRMTGFLVR